MSDRDGRSEETDAINDAADRILAHLNQIAGMLRNFGKLKPILDRIEQRLDQRPQAPDLSFDAAANDARINQLIDELKREATPMTEITVADFLDALPVGSANATPVIIRHDFTLDDVAIWCRDSKSYDLLIVEYLDQCLAFHLSMRGVSTPPLYGLPWVRLFP